MLKALSLLASCALVVACGGGSSSPTTPTKVPSLSRTRFLAFGDSMTSGEVTVPVGAITGSNAGLLNPPNVRMVLVPSASYPTQLLAMAQARYSAQASAVTIANAGKPGEYSFQAAPRFADTIAEVKPEVVLLLHGVNDLPFQNSDLPASSLRDMTIQAKRAGSMVFLATLMPFKSGGRNSPNAALVDELNGKIKAMAAAEGVVLVNLFDTLLPEANTVIGVDGLHPTEVGYKRMADVFFASIQANLEVK
jgi:lysophospholipase L1-like esterase